MILLDTSAAIWFAQGHRRARALDAFSRLYLSPASLLEIRFLEEIGRLRLSPGLTAAAVARDPRWRLDEPPAGRWFEEACELTWTRDPFDRLLAAHARVRRWKLATGDDQLIERLPATDVIPL